ncbi:MAG: hypothetical protein ACFCVB_21935, partial [Nodosilinea sp.]
RLCGRAQSPVSLPVRIQNGNDDLHYTRAAATGGRIPENAALERTVERVLQRYMGSGGLGRPATPTLPVAEGVSSTDPMLVPPGEEVSG